MLGYDMDAVRGCIHETRDRTKKCVDCGNLLCYECYFDAVVGQRVVASTSVDRQVQADYVTMCAACYLEWAAKNGKGPIREKLTFWNALIIDAKYPLIGNQSRGCGCFNTITTILFIPMLIGFLFWYLTYDTLKYEYNKQQKAFAILEQHKAAAQIASESTT